VKEYEKEKDKEAIEFSEKIEFPAYR